MALYSGYAKLVLAFRSGTGYISPVHCIDDDRHENSSSNQIMVNTRRTKSIYDLPLVFQAGDDEPVIFPHGTFGKDVELVECDVTPPSEEELYDTYQAEETVNGYGNDSFQIYDPSNDFEDGWPDASLAFDRLDEENTSFYRAYDVFIYKDPEHTAKTQFYILRDFEYDSHDNIVILPTTFAVVSLLMVMLSD